MTTKSEFKSVRGVAKQDCVADEDGSVTDSCIPRYLANQILTYQH
jgi:hypothetical protein